MQLTGTAMGSPMSPIVADLVMEILLDTVTRELDFDIPVLRKFVDDLIIALPVTQVENTLHKFNQYNTSLQFTMEQEVECKLPFLDTLVIRHQDQTISTEWYAKPIASGRLLNWHSFHPLQMKVQVADNFIQRVFRLTTNQTRQQQKQIISKHLRNNDYPTTLINRLSNKYPIQHIHGSTPTPVQHLIQHPHGSSLSLNQQQPPTPPTDTDQHHSNHTGQHTTPMNVTANQQPAQTNDDNNTPSISQQNTAEIPAATTVAPEAVEVYRSLPYVPKLSQIVARSLKTDYGLVKIASTTVNTVGQIFNSVKDPISTEQQSNVVYSIPCGNCGMTYIGMTKNRVKTRLAGHQSNINKYSKLSQTQNTNTTQQISELSEKTALIHHQIEFQHTFDLTKTKIIDKTYRPSALPILEMCHITNTPNTVNFRTDTSGLNTTYAGILHLVKCNQRATPQ